MGLLETVQVLQVEETVIARINQRWRQNQHARRREQSKPEFRSIDHRRGADVHKIRQTVGKILAGDQKSHA